MVVRSRPIEWLQPAVKRSLGRFLSLLLTGQERKYINVRPSFRFSVRPLAPLPESGSYAFDTGRTAR